MATSISGRFSHDRALHFSLCGAQMLLASFFAAMATLKLVLHFHDLVEIMGWAASLPAAFVRTLGAVELLGAFVIAVPAVTKGMQRAVGWVASGFLAFAVVAALVHIARGELRMLPISIAVGTLAAFVAWARLRHAPLQIDEPL